jgi:hypothetical protein
MQFKACKQDEDEDQGVKTDEDEVESVPTIGRCSKHAYKV